MAKKSNLVDDSKDRLKFFVKILIVFLLIIALYNLFSFLFNKKKYSDKFIKTNFNIEYETSVNGTEFYIYDEGIYFLSKNGVKMLNANNKVLWENIYSLNYPVFMTNEKYVLAMENKGNSLYVYDNLGLTYNLEFEFPILSASINKNGYISTILKESESSYIIKAFSNSGEEIAVVPQTIKEVFPTSCDISEDNRILAFSTLDITGIEMESHLMFFYLDPAESSEKTNIKLVSGNNEKNQIITIVKFMENNNLITISDTNIIGQREGEKLQFKETFRIEMNNKIKKLDFIDGKGLSYIIGDEILNKKGEVPGTIKTISTTGKTVSEFVTNMDITYIYSGLEHTILGDSTTFVAFDKYGKIIWEYNSISNIKQLMFCKNVKTLLEVSTNKANILKQKRVRNR